AHGARRAARARGARHRAFDRGSGRAPREVSGGRRWVLATGNRGKLAELRSLFGDAGLDLEVVPQTDLGIGPAAEDGVTFVENALAEARHAGRASGRTESGDVSR